jgi:hypothetical protein
MRVKYRSTDEILLKDPESMTPVDVGGGGGGEGMQRIVPRPLLTFTSDEQIGSFRRIQGLG